MADEGSPRHSIDLANDVLDATNARVRRAQPVLTKDAAALAAEKEMPIHGNKCFSHALDPARAQRGLLPAHWVAWNSRAPAPKGVLGR